MSVVGFDNIEFSQMVSPPLTTVQQPDYEMGKMACHLLIDQLTGKRTDNIDITLQPKIIERQSTQALKR